MASESGKGMEGMREKEALIQWESLNDFGCFIHHIPLLVDESMWATLAPLETNSDSSNLSHNQILPSPCLCSSPVGLSQIQSLKEIWRDHAILIIKGEKQLTPINQLKLLRVYQEKIARDSEVEDEYSPINFEKMNETIEQLQHEYFRLQNDANLTVTHLQDDIKLEKQKQANSQEQLAAFHELEEYSAGLRDECSKLEDTANELRTKFNDLERSYAVLYFHSFSTDFFRPLTS